jgi:pyruvate-formate lyase
MQKHHPAPKGYSGLFEVAKNMVIKISWIVKLFSPLYGEIFSGCVVIAEQLL